jgi:hypothetical protein
MRAALPWLALLAFSPLAQCDPTPASDAAQVLEDCAAMARAADTSQSLLQQCPDLERALIDLGLIPQLAPDWQRGLNRTALAELAQQARHYQSPPLSSAPHIDSLPLVMQALQRVSVHQSRWQQFKEWLASLLRQPPQNVSWLRNLLAHLALPPLLARVLGYAMVAAVLCLALWIVRREFKALGVLTRGRRGRRVRGENGRATRTAESEAGLPDLEALPLWQRPAALLAALVQALQRSGRLSRERALTHRELGERGTFDDAAQRTRFVDVSRLAERRLYGERGREESAAPDPQTLQVLADGLELYRQLRA